MVSINVSPESFYKNSIAITPRQIKIRASNAIERGADILDVGAMSTAPYLKTTISQETEITRIKAALNAIFAVDSDTPVSVDTIRSSVAEVGLNLGATMINDVSGLQQDSSMARVVRDHDAMLLAMAHMTVNSKISKKRTNPISLIESALKRSLAIADNAGIAEKRIILDPGIGFFRKIGHDGAWSSQSIMPWYRWDCFVIRNLKKLASLGRPICVGVSRKSFIGKILKVDDPHGRLAGSVGATAIAVMNGAKMIRAHDVAETLDVVRIAEAIMGRGSDTHNSNKQKHIALC